MSDFFIVMFALQWVAILFLYARTRFMGRVLSECLSYLAKQHKALSDVGQVQNEFNKHTSIALLNIASRFPDLKTLMDCNEK